MNIRSILWCIILSFFATALLSEENIITENNPDENFRAAVKFIEKKNYAEAINIFSELAEAQIPEAQYNLSLMSYNGLGVPKNFKDALVWSWKAYLNGHNAAKGQAEKVITTITPELQDAVANQIIDELLVEANAGVKNSTLKLGQTYMSLLVQPNFGAAYVWLSIAQAYGIEDASPLLNEVGDQLPIEEVLVQQDEAMKIFMQINQ